MSAGDVALVRYPFSDATGSEQRPALVLATADPGPDQDYVAVFIEITGSERRIANMRAGDLYAERWREMSLLKPSVIRCRRLFSTEMDLVIRRLGAADDETFEQVVLEVRRLLAIA